MVLPSPVVGITISGRTSEKLDHSYPTLGDRRKDEAGGRGVGAVRKFVRARPGPCSSVTVVTRHGKLLNMRWIQVLIESLRAAVRCGHGEPIPRGSNSG